MTHVRFQNRPSEKAFNNLVDGFFSSFPSLYRDDFAGTYKPSVPVNVKETASGYALEIVAPGFSKEDFKIDLADNILTISGERKEATEDKNEKSLRREYKFGSFKRSFTVDETIDAAAISAKYVNGVLALNLPRKEEVKEPAKQITIE